MKQWLTAMVFLVYGYIFAQYEAANWYFGENVGINFNFNTGQVSTLSDGRLNTIEGSSSISDSQGNLLFYTDGTTVYNRNHQVMTNGNGLYGNSSSTQSAVVIPKPNNDDIFYVFTVGSSALQATNHGFNYSVVDITGDNGLGEVTSEKNKNLLAFSSEKISAVVKDCNTQAIWVITLSTASGESDERYIFNTYYAYEITSSGINTTPVKSTFISNIQDARGALKFSPDGTKMAAANMIDGLYLYDFDADTGIVTNQQALRINSIDSNKPYGVEFSSNNQFLYIHASNDLNGREGNIVSDHRSSLIQYELDAPNISDSQVILDQRTLFRGALQLGPDGKIYRALAATYDLGTPYLGVIENPNAKGSAANYQHNAIRLTSNSTQGLPPFIQSFFNQKIDIINNASGIKTNILPLCDNETYTLQATDIPNATYLWTLDGVDLNNNSSQQTVTKPGGYYKVIITPPNSTVCDISEGEAYVSYYDLPIAYPPNPDLNFVCDVNNDNVERFDLTQQNNTILGSQTPSDYNIQYFKNQRDADSNNNAILNPNSYEVDSQNQTIYARIQHISNPNCYSLTNFEIDLIPTPTLVVQDLSSCDKLTPYSDGKTAFNLNNAILNTNTDVTFYTSDPAIVSTATPILNPSSYQSTQNNQTLYAKATNGTTGCYTVASFKLVTIDAPVTTQTSYFCSGFDTILEANIPISSPANYNFAWLDSSNTVLGTSPTLTVGSEGLFRVIITDNTSDCIEVNEFNVIESTMATLAEPITTHASEDNTITVNATGNGNYEYALFNNHGEYINYQTSHIFTHVSPGIYTIKVREVLNNCGTAEQTVHIIGFPAFFTPNGDGYNDTWQIQGTSETFQPNSKVLIFNRFGTLIKEITPLGSPWDGTINGERLPVDDYWFRVTLENGKVFNSHFTLKY
ncbi:T9SS type B sorting domain-containing protein [Formosa haliotis]|uniref:T9SS type B sorting domain-containing protein n=1 Tax=Formosa haliotis TaxID=1555194 RepID=UPI000824513C|nr:T9SS type B sorting domain-containing protein [Formosa haliotis]